ncbi:helix-turn-helix domain-containing protein [Croceicoccus hydrothermalis]|uniref:helix-turn-helix domain-containing protein n=1 Tax=Croceicoccus hydrothermalis TaxID=2867964 RepID=UPI0023BA902B|nr:helix-turn-helix transcriptional regulator [Croceicoccus hydrothermalis]
MSSILGRKVRDLRQKKGMTLEQLATATGSSKSYIWEIENKPVARPSAEKLGRIASVLGVTSEYLVDEERTEPPVADDFDRAFYRKYHGASDPVKQKLKRILDVLDDE